MREKEPWALCLGVLNHVEEAETAKRISLYFHLTAIIFWYSPTIPTDEHDCRFRELSINSKSIHVFFFLSLRVD